MNAKVLMEIEEEAWTPANNQDIQRDKTPQKVNKSAFPFLQVTVPGKHKKEVESNEPSQKTNQNIIGYIKHPFFF